MRFSTTFVLAAAVGAYALPQEQPISQISDGQIQAPPATAPAEAPSAPAVPSVPAAPSAPSAPAATEVLPSVTPVPLPSVVPSEAVPSEAVPTEVVPVPAPSAPAASGSAVVPKPSVPAVSSAVSYPNSTVPLPTGGESAPSGSSPPRESAPINSGATANMVSLGALVAALVACFA